MLRRARMGIRGFCVRKRDSQVMGWIIKNVRMILEWIRGILKSAMKKKMKILDSMLILEMVVLKCQGLMIVSIMDLITQN